MPGHRVCRGGVGPPSRWPVGNLLRRREGGRVAAKRKTCLVPPENSRTILQLKSQQRANVCVGRFSVLARLFLSFRPSLPE